ncbi:MAG TPA: class I SAM-dependent methyltransferase [Methylomirabilota bacterium]|nr:class I SAM-dependent methyltransferase [Methylomirabilota bacterium]
MNDTDTIPLPLEYGATPSSVSNRIPLDQQLAEFKEFGNPTVVQSATFESPTGGNAEVRVFVNEYWTARQRQAHSLHEISYRACFKPQLPRFFIERLTAPGEIVYDPFMGRGTTPIEAALLGRVPYGCDINPLSLVFAGARLRPPQSAAVEARLREVDFSDPGEMPEDLLVFYHPYTLREVSALRKFLMNRRASGRSDDVDNWITAVAINRLTGHSAGFFSVYTLPPNQATSVKAQQRINERRNQVPPRRDVKSIVLKKSRQLLGDCDPRTRITLGSVTNRARLLNGPAAATPEILDGSVSLVVTSPPFLSVVNYAGDNWLRCWFLGVDAKSIQLTNTSRLPVWQEAMTAVFRELRRVLKPGGRVAFEVGEVSAGAVKLELAVLPCGVEAGLRPELVLVNAQKFTKTANCWGVDNNEKGTNSNRVVVFEKSA